MELVFNGTRFETHRYLIKRFKKWAVISPKLRPGSIMTVTGTASSEDFGRMLRVLYATTLEGPFEFDTPTLVAALHIATDYEYPALRDYAIRHLERAELTAIKRIEVARRFGLLSWVEPAYWDLCNRDESITEEEASILGISAFVRVANIREKEQRRRGRGIDAEREEETSKLGGPKLDNVNVNEGTVALPPLSADKGHPKELPGPSRSTESQNTDTEATGSNGVQAQTETPETEPQPSFMAIEMSQMTTYISGFIGKKIVGLAAPGCSCSYESARRPNGQIERIPSQCMLPACAVLAFKNLQTEQLAHKRSIRDLQSVVDELRVMSKPELGHTGRQEVNAPGQAASPMHEEVQVMLSELLQKGPRNWTT
ncbi:hypothetical protein ACGC1H_001750 [Rhizoctonia solani]